MMMKYEINNLGKLRHFLRGLKFIKVKNGYLFHIKRYDEIFLKKSRMFGCKPIATPLFVNEKLMKKDGKRNVDATLYRCPIEN